MASRIPPPDRLSPSRSEPSGFTLVELLVVIAILAILASLLLPAVSGAKLKAHGIRCMSNMKQMQLAWLMYADGHAGVHPWKDSRTCNRDSYNKQLVSPNNPDILWMLQHATGVK